MHPDGFYITDINIHRAMVAITFVNLDEVEKLKDKEGVINEQAKMLGEVDIIWVGTHDDYLRIFGNNKDTVKKWLRSQGHIS